MTATTPIPLDAFVAELESLDSNAFAALVAETYAATADDVAVDGPRVTVTDDGRRTELLAVADADRNVPDDAVDAVAVASDAPLDEGVAEGGVTVVAPADLRERLLYAVPPAEANAIADRYLGVSVRSGAYEAVDGGGDAPDVDGGAAEADAGGADDDTGAPASDTDAPDGANVRKSADDDTTDDATAAVAASGAAGSAPASKSLSPGRDAPGSVEDSQSDDPSSNLSRRRTAVAAVAVVALLVAAAGAGFAAGAAGLGGPGGIGGAADDRTTDPGTTESGTTEPANGSDDGSGESLGGDDGANTVSVADGDPTGEAERNTALAPTCERSALQVVQIQMNALRYNDNATNDGIRTLRAFASPENREVVGSTDEYAELFETARYGPMLTYDTAEFSVPVIDDGTAEVEVVTRENGSVTGRYEFRLVRVGGGTGESDGSLGDVDDCWMTDAVAASSE